MDSPIACEAEPRDVMAMPAPRSAAGLLSRLVPLAYTTVRICIAKVEEDVKIGRGSWTLLRYVEAMHLVCIGAMGQPALFMCLVAHGASASLAVAAVLEGIAFASAVAMVTASAVGGHALLALSF